MAARGGPGEPLSMPRAYGFLGRIGHEAASGQDEPCRVMARVPGSARPASAGRVADASGQILRSRSCVRHNTGMADGYRRSRPVRLPPAKERQAVGAPGRGCPCGRPRRADRSDGCDGTRAAGRVAGTGGCVIQCLGRYRRQHRRADRAVCISGVRSGCDAGNHLHHDLRPRHLPAPVPARSSRFA
jgi:hypothetical protein